VIGGALRRRTCAALVLGLAACAAPRAGSGAAPGSATADDAAGTGIRAALDSTAAGWNRGDLAGYLSAYDDSVTSRGAEGFVRGKEAAAEVMRQGFWRTGRPLQQLHYDHLEVRALGPDHALVTGRFVLTGADRPECTGWFSTVWERTGGTWRMIHDHS
jgi:uncharacterized protein (TIGR02246 family)